MEGYLTNPLAFLLEVIFGAYIVLVLLRFFLQLVKADFYNQLSQFVVKATSPVLVPIRRLVPGVKGIDLASLVLAWLLKSIELFLVLLIQKGVVAVVLPVLWAIPELLELTINIFMFAIFMQVILSWINPGGYHPATAILYSLTEPLLAPLRRTIKPMAGLDLGPMVAILGLILLKMILLPPLRTLVTGIAA